MRVSKVVLEWHRLGIRGDLGQYLDRYCVGHVASCVGPFDGFHEYEPIMRWCDGAFGVGEWHNYLNKFWFSNEEDLLQFKLAWECEA